MFTLKFQIPSGKKELSTKYIARRLDDIYGETTDKLDETSMSPHQTRAGKEEQVRAPHASKLLIIVTVFSLCVALAVFCFVNGRFLLGAWVASAFLAWAFLLGAADATDQLSCDQERDDETRLDSSISALRGAARELRAKAPGLKTDARAEVESLPPAEPIAPTHSLPSSLTEEIRSGRLRLVRQQSGPTVMGKLAQEDGDIPADLKAAVALAAMRGDRTAGELAVQFGIRPGQVRRWKGQLIRESTTVFRSQETRSREGRVGL